MCCLPGGGLKHLKKSHNTVWLNEKTFLSLYCLTYKGQIISLTSKCYVFQGTPVDIIPLVSYLYLSSIPNEALSFLQKTVQSS